jgi:prepilin-type N-terminal cleavage/methylation domain-containing protein
MRSGFTALEVMFATALLAVAIMALIACIGSGDALDQQTREDQVAASELNRVMEQLRGRSPAQVIAGIYAAAPANSYTETLSTDIGIESGEGKTVTVLPNASITLTVQTEDQVQSIMGLSTPPDLDENNDHTNSDMASYKMAPVLATISWTRATPSGGTATVSRTMFTIFYPSSMSH